MIVLRDRKFSLISKGIRFFKELKKIEELPINFSDYSTLLELNMKKKINDPEYVRISDIVNSYYRSPNASKALCKIGLGLFGSWCFENKINPFTLKDRTGGFRFSYNHIQKLPKRYIIDSLGAGGFGVCFDYPFNRVEKISFKGFTNLELKFYEFQKKTPLPIFPKVYTLEPDQVVMEKLIVDSPKIRECKELIEEYTDKIQSGTFPYREVNWNKVNKELGNNHWFSKLLKDIEDGLDKIYGMKTVGDLSHNNIGQRKSGELVFFDPVGGKLLMQ